MADLTITLTISDTDQTVLKNDLLSIDDWVQDAMAGKISNCWKRMQTEWTQKLMNDDSFTDPIPSNRADFVLLHGVVFMEIIQKFVLVTILLMDSGEITPNTVVLSQCPDKKQYYTYMEGRAEDASEDIRDWRAACIPVAFSFEKKQST